MKDFVKTTIYTADYTAHATNYTVSNGLGTSGTVAIQANPAARLEFKANGEIRLEGGARAEAEVINLLLKLQRQAIHQNSTAASAFKTLARHLEWSLKYVRRDKDINSGVSSNEIEAALSLLNEYFK